MVRHEFSKKIEIFIVIFMLIISSMTLVGIIPGFLGAEGGSDAGVNPATQASSARGSSRSIDYDMNLSRPGKHQDMTIYGRREPLIGETPPPINSTIVGDVDGDGLDDLIIGAPGDNISTNEDCGAIFVIFGQSMLPTSYDLTNVTDLVISGLDLGDYEGFALAVGDVNGDGVGDIISGVPGADGSGNSFTDIGEAHIYYGGSYLKNIDIWWQNQTAPNVTIVGNNTGDHLGFSVAAGNLNSDIYDDIIMGAPWGDGYINTFSNAGEVWILYGSSSLFAIEELNAPSIPEDVKVIYNFQINDYFGTAVASGGDFNGDDFDDVAFATRYADGFMDTGNTNGEAAIIYWNNSMPPVMNMAMAPTQSANFTVYGANQYDRLGFNTLTFGDVNDDNLSDLIVGAPGVNGQSGSVPDSGAAYIFYGSPAYMSPFIWDLAATPANVTVYSSLSFEELGTWVDSFDWNDDGVDDLIITIPFGSGPGDAYLNAGELVIFNGSKSLPATMTVQTASLGFYLFGADENDLFGTLTAHGDLNGDTIQDLVVLAKNADSFNNSRKDAGEMYVIRGETSKIPRINSIEIKNADVPIGATLYTRLKPYEFELNITAPLGVNDLKNATIQLDPFGMNLIFKWVRAGNMFSEFRDPNNYASIVSGSQNVSNDGDKNWTISFNLIFNWECPRVNLAPVRVDLWNELNYLTWRSYLGVFSIENRLNFTGNLLVTGDSGRTLNDNDWVRREEVITWRGYKVVYEGTTALHPDAAEYTVKLWNSTRSWLDSSSTTGAEINITITTGTKSISFDNYTLNITKIPLANDNSNVTFTLQLDAENIHYIDPLPTPGTWQNVTLVQCGITAIDTGGTQVSGSSIDYRLSDNGGITWSNWTSAEFSTDGVSVDVTKTFSFADSADHQIQWRGNDTIGNGYGISLNYSIKVDTEDIIFSNPTPVETDIFDTTTVVFSIDIIDNTSGVNTSTIEYTYSLNGGLTWSDWINLNLTGTSTNVKAVANQTFITGTGNMVKWRAMDEAGNGPIESEPQKFNISLTSSELKVFLLSPQNNLEVASGSRTLKWWCNDNSTNILFNVYLSKSLQNVERRVSLAWVGRNIPDKFFETDILDNNSVYYWTVIPRNITGTYGISEYGIWKFEVNPSVVELDEPEIEPLSPTNNSEIQTLTPTFSWKLLFKDDTGVVFDIYLGTNKDNLNLYEAGLNRYSYRTPSTEPLDNHQTYYWQMKAQGGEIIGMYWSPIWTFHINFTSVIVETYDFDLYSEKLSVEIKQGGSTQLVFSVINLKKPETVTLSVQSSILGMTNETIFTFSPNDVQLGENDTKQVTLTITIPKDLKAGDYKFTIVGKMTISGDTITKTLPIDLTVKSVGKDDDDDKGADMTLALVAVVIIIIIILILVFLLMKRRKKGEEAPPEERITEEPMEEELPVAEAMETEAPMAAPAAMAVPVAAPEAEVPPEVEEPLGGLEEALVEPGPEEAVPPDVEAPPVAVAAPVAPAPEPVPTEPAPAVPPPEAEAPPITEQPPEAMEPEMPTEELPSGAVEEAAPAAAPEGEPQPEPTEEPATEDKPKEEEETQ